MDFLLNIFPPGSLSQSVITTVWLGIWVIVFFNQRLGWSMSGLIIPGYVVPLMVLKPISAAVILAEGLITYLLGAFLFKWLPRLGFGWSVFGRDRFFMLVLLSVVVRVVGDGFVLPALLVVLDEQFSIPFEYRSQLHSFGLIIVALIANYFWGQGLRRGAIPFSVILGVTYFLVRYGLLAYTNFTISNVEYLYEDLAGDILAAPKAYVILLTAAFIASRMNLLYGWEFNGILVPSLMALLWYQPAKLVISLLEAGLVLGLGTLLLRSRLFEGVTVEGGRKLLLFFNIGFFYKMALGYLLAYYAPELKTTDFFGIGYLITTLLAVKMHDKDLLLPMTRATLQVSLTAALVANGLGFLLTYLPAERAVIEQEHRPAPPPARDFGDLNRHMPLALYRSNARDAGRRPTQAETEQFAEVLRVLLQARADNRSQEVVAARTKLRALSYRLVILEKRWFYLYEDDSAQGWGLYLIDSLPERDLLIQISAPLEESLTLPAGLNLVRRLGARVLAVNGTSTQTAQAIANDPLSSVQSFFSVCRTVAGAKRTLQLREQTAENRRFLARFVGDYDRENPVSLAFVKRGPPHVLSLQALEANVGRFQTYFSESPFANFQRDQAATGFIELFLDRRALRRLMAAPLNPAEGESGPTHLAGSLEAWVQRERDSFAAAASELYRPPSPAELLSLNDILLAPLNELLRDRAAIDAAAFDEELGFIAGRAAALRWQLLHAQTAAGNACLLLREAPTSARRYDGFYVFRLDPSHAYSVMVPHPLYEVGTLNVGLLLFETLQARALLVHGAHQFANRDLSADPLQSENKETVFNLVYQSLHKTYFDQAMLGVQVRALAETEGQTPRDVSVVAAFDRGAGALSARDGLAQALVAQLQSDGERVAVVNGSQATAGYGLGANPQNLYLAHLPHHQLVALRFDARLRDRFRDVRDSNALGAVLRAMAVPSLPINALPLDRPPGRSSLDQNELAALQHFLATRDITALAALRDSADTRLFHGLDADDGAAYLLVTAGDGRFKALANLAVREPAEPIYLDADSAISDQVAFFMQHRQALLLFGGAP